MIICICFFLFRLNGVGRDKSDFRSSKRTGNINIRNIRIPSSLHALRNGCHPQERMGKWKNTKSASHQIQLKKRREYTGASNRYENCKDENGNSFGNTVE